MAKKKQVEVTEAKLEREVPATPAPVENEDRLKSPSVEETKPVAEVDYLRQYQYRKQTPFGSKLSDPMPGSKAAQMKAILLAQPRVRIFVPRDGKEDLSIKIPV